MIAVKGQSFGVRFYRRSAPKSAMRKERIDSAPRRADNSADMSGDRIDMSAIQNFMPQDVAIYEFDLREMALEPLSLLEEEGGHPSASAGPAVAYTGVQAMMISSSAFVLGAAVLGEICSIVEDFNLLAEQRRPFFVIRFKPFKAIRSESLPSSRHLKESIPTLSTSSLMPSLASASVEDVPVVIEERPAARPPYADLVALARQAAQLVREMDDLKNVAGGSEEHSGVREIQLWIAAREGDCAAIRRLVLEGADLEARDDLGRNAINIAMQYNQPRAAKTLLAAKEMQYMARIGGLPDSTFFQRFKAKKA